ncbi:MAG: transglycosylase SLT domain-containing protein [Nanoarchaeota archaeon]
MKNKLTIVFAVLLAVALISQVSGVYQRSMPSIVPIGPSGTGFGFSGNAEKIKCETGQDFILNVAPLGCSPLPVSDDLLEDQDTPVFCELTATKINPLVSVNGIKNIEFKIENSEYIKSIEFHPSLGALGNRKVYYDSSLVSSIGYAVILLKQQKNTSNIPDFVEGSINATLRYDAENAFGVGDATFYLPVFSDEEWQSVKDRYSFWNGRAYIRADDTGSDSADISIFNDVSSIARVNLDKGKSSNIIYLPGFECQAGLNLKLVGVENPGTRARFIINGEEVEVKEKESFLNDKCVVNSITRQGVVERVSGRCKEDKGSKDFNLFINPKIKIKAGDTVGDYKVGDFLYEFKDGVDVYYAYLGYADTGDSGSEDNLRILIMALPDEYAVSKKALTTEQVEIARKIAESRRFEPKGGLIDWSSEAGKSVIGFFNSATRRIVSGTQFEVIAYGSPEKFGEKDVSIIGFSDAEDFDLSKNQDILNYYQEALRDYDNVINSYSGDKYPLDKDVTKAEESFVAKIQLANDLQQNKDVVDFCNSFREVYPRSSKISDVKNICGDKRKLSSQETNSKNVEIFGNVKEIALEGIYEPRFEDFGVEISVTGPKGQVTYSMEKNQIIYLNDDATDYMQLLDIQDNNKAKFYFYISKNSLREVRDFFSSPNEVLEKDKSVSFGSVYSFNLVNVNLKKVAKVTIEAQVNNKESKAVFPFKLGIEKRSIQLSPDEIRKRIETTNKTLEEWKNKNEKLGKIVQTMKTACVATGGILTIKNLINNLGMKAIARSEVMTKSSGWREICQERIKNKSYGYKDFDDCIAKNSAVIDKDVGLANSILENHNNELKGYEKNCQKEGLLGSKVVDSECVAKALASDKYKEDLRKNLNEKLKPDVNGDVEIGEEKINIDKFVNNLDYSKVPLETLREFELYSRFEGTESLNGMSKARLTSIMKQIHLNTKAEVERKTDTDYYGVEVDYGNDPNIKVAPPIPIVKDTYLKDIKGINIVPMNPDTHARVYKDTITTKSYVIVIDNNYHVSQTYEILGDGQLNMTETPNPLNLNFKKYSSADYQNTYKSSFGDTVPVLRYFETEPYKGFPALVPFDIVNGWYVSIKQTLPNYGALRAYDESGLLNSFYICNVGKDGVEHNRISPDDECQLINSGTGQPYGEFYGLKDEEAKSLVQAARQAVESVGIAKPGQGIARVKMIQGYVDVKVGAPAVDIPDIQCQDFMSYNDCRILFNVCDPVICPSSRCDLGGAYPVKNVIQSGVIGSVALCLPNFPEVYVPICLSGVHAGIDGWTKILESYQKCLNEKLETGANIGICDEITSFYKCKFFVEQGLPLAKFGVSQAIEVISGQNVRGGGEYLGVQAALDSASDSVKYFTQYYADDSYKAFKSRSFEEFGKDLTCSIYISGGAASLSSAIETFTKPDSPTQFNAWFEESPITTATNPPTSHYKVFYHIYAGQDQGVYYRVFLKGSTSSFYQDTSASRTVSQGYINAGEVADDTPDFTDYSGWRELCVTYNQQTECGFKQVSTDFGLNYITEKYIQEQSDKRNIKTAKECVQGTPSIYSFANPNPQAGASEFVNPDIYNSGITRICATNNPGGGDDSSPDKSRWISVGYCDDKTMICWLDTKSIKDVVKNANIEADILDKARSDAEKVLLESGNFIRSDAEYEDALKNVTGSSLEKISKLSEIIERIFFSHQKAHSLFLRGNEYGLISIDKKQKLPEVPGDKEAQTSDDKKKQLEDLGFSCDGLTDEQCNLIYQIYAGEVSPVFKVIKVNSLIFDFLSSDDEVYLKYSLGEWFWSDNNINWLSVADVVTREPGAFIDIIKELNEMVNGEKKTYAQGLNLMLKRADSDGMIVETSFVTFNTDFNKDSSLKNVFILNSPEVVAVLPIPGLGGTPFGYAPVNFGTLKLPIYFRYTNQWEWRPCVEGARYCESLGALNSWHSVSNDSVLFENDFGNQIDEFRKMVIGSLKTKDFNEGAKELFNVNIYLRYAEEVQLPEEEISDEQYYNVIQETEDEFEDLSIVFDDFNLQQYTQDEKESIVDDFAQNGYPVFEFDNLLFQHKNGRWYWGFEEDCMTDAFSNHYSNTIFDENCKNHEGDFAPDELKDFITLLDRKSYDEGVKILAEKSLEIKKDLKSDRVTIDSKDKVFEVMQGEGYDKFYVAYSEPKWRYTFDTPQSGVGNLEQWALSGDLAPPPRGSVQDMPKLESGAENILSYLEEKNFLDGVLSLFNMNFLDYFSNREERLQQEAESFEDEFEPKVCEDCGKGTLNLNGCDENECREIAVKTGLNCVFENSNCVNKIQAIELPPPIEDVLTDEEIELKEVEIKSEAEIVKGVMQQAISDGISVSVTESNGKVVTKSVDRRCLNYIDEALVFSKKYGIDALLLISLMNQESSCSMEAKSSAHAYGLMQITLIHCGTKGLSADKIKCKEELLTNPSKSLEAGSAILREYYNWYNGDSKKDSSYNNKVAKYCKVNSYRKKYLEYSGWERSLRAYNGLGCIPPNSDVFYVERIFGMYNKLKNLA